MSDKAGRAASMRHSINVKENEKRGYESQKREYEEKIERLKRVRTYVSEMISRRVFEPSKVERIAQEAYYEVWAGNEYSGVKDTALGGIYTGYHTYIRRLDEIQDALCDEITRLENKCREAEGIIGSLRNAINSLWNEIEKLFN